MRAGVTEGEIRGAYNVPIPKTLRAGDIIAVPARPLNTYVAGVGEDYKKIALKLGVSEGELRKLNGSAPVYPTRKIYY